MRKFIAGLLVGLVIAGAAAATAAPGDLRRSNPTGGNSVLVPQIAGTPCWRISNQVFRPDGTPISVCTPPATTTTTAAPTTTTVAPTTTVPVTEPPTTTVAPTTTTTTSAPPSGVQWVETFDTAASLDRIITGVYHRNIGAQTEGQPPSVWGDNNAGHGGTWPGDHDLTCGPPSTSRTLSSTKTSGGPSTGWKPVVDFNLDEIVYWCPNAGGHFMSSMGDVDGYSVLWMSPAAVLSAPTEVCVDVNLTDLGTRQWLKLGVVQASLWDQTVPSWLGSGEVPAWLASDVDASALAGDLQNASELWVSYSGGLSGGHPGGIKIGDGGGTSGAFTAGEDKMTRYEWCVIDDQAGITVTISDPTGIELTRASQPGGDFPAGDVRVVLADHNYTPLKSESGTPIGFTWHWDNLIVR